MNYVTTHHSRTFHRDPLARVAPRLRCTAYHWWRVARDCQKIDPRNMRHVADRVRLENELLEFDAMEGGNI